MAEAKLKDQFPSFQIFATAMMVEIVEAFVLSGSTGVRAKLSVWLPIYLRWHKEMGGDK